MFVVYCRLSFFFFLFFRLSVSILAFLIVNILFCLSDYIFCLLVSYLICQLLRSYRQFVLVSPGSCIVYNLPLFQVPSIPTLNSLSIKSKSLTFMGNCFYDSKMDLTDPRILFKVSHSGCRYIMFQGDIWNSIVSKEIVSRKKVIFF